MVNTLDKMACYNMKTEEHTRPIHLNSSRINPGHITHLSFFPLLASYGLFLRACLC